MSQHHQYHFVFVHGACHGAWCWYKVQSMLKKCGHKATSIDLRSAGIDLTDANTVSSLDDYNQPLFAFFSNLSDHDKVILVGHSVGGVSITAAMGLFPRRVSMAVYVAARMIKPGALVPPEVRSESIWDFTYGDGPDEPPTSVMMKAKYVQDKYYNRSPMEDYTLATSLLRPAPIRAFHGAKDIPTSPEIENIPRVYVKTGKDHMFPSSAQDNMVTHWPPSQLFVLEDSDHSAFFSVPEALYDCLLQAASSLPN